MSRRIGLWIAIALAAAAAAIVVPLFLPSPGKPAGPAGLAGQPAPNVPVRDLAGRTVALPQLRGNVVVVNLWGSWCPPCRAEMPDLQRLAAAYGARGVRVIGVNEGESAERAGAFATSLGIRFPIWLDERQEYGRAFSALGMPTTVIVNRNGTIVRAFDGALSYDQMRAAVADQIGTP